MSDQQSRCEAATAGLLTGAAEGRNGLFPGKTVLLLRLGELYIVLSFNLTNGFLILVFRLEFSAGVSNFLKNCGLVAQILEFWLWV